MEPDKHWWQSKTILGAVAVLVATVVRLITGSEDLQEHEILDLLTEGAQLAGALMALFGRFKANGPLQPLKKPKE